MNQDSTHLENIIKNHNNIANIQVFFIDIEKYSKRRTATQSLIINSFIECLRKSLRDISKEYVYYTQNNNINLQRDIIIIPTGDGAAIVFSFDGLHDIHLKFSTIFLRHINDHN